MVVNILIFFVIVLCLSMVVLVIHLSLIDDRMRRFELNRKETENHIDKLIGICERLSELDEMRAEKLAYHGKCIAEIKAIMIMEEQLLTQIRSEFNSLKDLKK